MSRDSGDMTHEARGRSHWIPAFAGMTKKERLVRA